MKALLAKARHQYEARKAAAEGQVVRWEHWSGPAYDPKPLYFERHVRAGLRGGKRLAKATARGCAYGFDANGRIVVDRQPAERGGDPATDEFFAYGTATVESAAYARDGKHELRYVTRQALRGGRVVATDVLDAGGNGGGAAHSERYAYRNRRLAEIDVTSVDGKQVKRVKYDVLYERDGTMRAIRRYFDYGTVVLPFAIYWNPGQTLASLGADLEKKLLDAIPKAIRKARLREPAYCLALVYNAEDGTDEAMLAPTLAIGLDRDRQAWVNQLGKNARDRLRSPDDFARDKNWIDLDDVPGLLDDSRRFVQRSFMDKKETAPQKLLNRVAAALNRQSWKGLLPTTDDFIVFATDLEGDDLKANIKAGVPEAKRKLLRSRGLL